MAPVIRDEFINESGGFIGVITIDGRGEHTPIAVAPGESAWLSEEEQIATANAPRSDTDNPLVNGALRLATSGHEVKNRRPLRPDPDAPPAPPVAEPDPEPEVVATGATPEPDGEPEEGEYADGEEVATPEAAGAPKPARRRRAAATAG